VAGRFQLRLRLRSAADTPGKLDYFIVHCFEGCIFGLFCEQVALVADHVVVSIEICQVQHSQRSLSHILSETLLAMLAVLSAVVASERGVEASAES